MSNKPNPFRTKYTTTGSMAQFMIQSEAAHASMPMLEQQVAEALFDKLSRDPEILYRIHMLMDEEEMLNDGRAQGEQYNNSNGTNTAKDSKRAER